MTSILITIGTIALAVTCAALVPSAPTVEQGIALGAVAICCALLGYWNLGLDITEWRQRRGTL
jgi:hypothetical protein